jgi:hypothetical protein
MHARAIAATMIVLCIGSRADAQEVRFVGAATITATAGACVDNRVGEVYAVRFRPANVGDNSNRSHLNLFDRTNAWGHHVAGLFTSTFKTAETTFVGYGSGPQDNQARIRFTAVRPRTSTGAAQGAITQGTRFIDITAVINGFDFDATCTSTFNIGVVRVFD